MNCRTKNILKDRIIPQPTNIDIIDGNYYRIENECVIKLILDNSLGNAEKECKKLAKLFWNCTPSFEIVYKSNEQPKTESYELYINEKCIAITASDERGLRYAFYSLRQLAEPERLVREHSHYIVPQVQIEDQPDLTFRGIHICWFPETKVWEVEKQIRLAAYYKINHIVIESWGIFPFDCEPDFCWRDKAVPKKEFERLVALSKYLGITLIPQINLLGHANWARGGGGKHAVLNMSPKYQSLYEPDGLCWCLNNPETRKLLASLVLELHNTFDNPPFFHIGCDEAHSMASCSICSERDIAKDITDHILFFHDLLKEKDTRVMMWHDMLLDKDDPQWSGYVANGRKGLGTTEIYKELPKDIVICDWEYEIPEVEEGIERKWPVSKFFKSNNFDVLVCPWTNMSDTYSLGKTACKQNLFGMLATTWHQNAGSNMYSIFFGSAEVAWNSNYKCYEGSGYGNLALHIRQIDTDMGMTDYVGFGMLYHHQISPARAQD